MNKILTWFVVSTAGAMLGFVLTNATKLGICAPEAYSCRGLLNTVGDPLMYGMAGLAFVFVVLALMPNAYVSWKKFAVLAIPLLAVLFFFARDPSNGLGVVSLGADRIQTFQWGTTAYVIGSVLVIFSSKLFTNPRWEKSVKWLVPIFTILVFACILWWPLPLLLYLSIFEQF